MGVARDLCVFPFLEDRIGKVQLKKFSSHDAGAVEGMVEPEVRGEGVVRGGGDYAVFEEVTGLESEDADGFDADVVVSGVVDDGRIGIIGDGAGKNVRSAAARVRDVDQRNLDSFKGAVVIEIEASELADAEFGVDADQSVNFLAAVAIDIETGAYAIGDTIISATRPLQAKNPDAQIWVARVGSRAIHRIGLRDRQYTQ